MSDLYKPTKTSAMLAFIYNKPVIIEMADSYVAFTITDVDVRVSGEGEKWRFKGKMLIDDSLMSGELCFSWASKLRSFEIIADE